MNRRTRARVQARGPVAAPTASRPSLTRASRRKTPTPNTGQPAAPLAAPTRRFHSTTSRGPSRPLMTGTSMGMLTEPTRRLSSAPAQRRLAKTTCTTTHFVPALLPPLTPLLARTKRSFTSGHGSGHGGTSFDAFTSDLPRELTQLEMSQQASVPLGSLLDAAVPDFLNEIHSNALTSGPIAEDPLDKEKTKKKGKKGQSGQPRPKASPKLTPEQKFNQTPLSSSTEWMKQESLVAFGRLQETGRDTTGDPLDDDGLDDGLFNADGPSGSATIPTSSKPLATPATPGSNPLADTTNNLAAAPKPSLLNAPAAAAPVKQPTKKTQNNDDDDDLDLFSDETDSDNAAAGTSTGTVPSYTSTYAFQHLATPPRVKRVPYYEEANMLFQPLTQNRGDEPAAQMIINTQTMVPPVSFTSPYANSSEPAQDEIPPAEGLPLDGNLFDSPPALPRQHKTSRPLNPPQPESVRRRKADRTTIDLDDEDDDDHITTDGDMLDATPLDGPLGDSYLHHNRFIMPELTDEERLRRSKERKRIRREEVYKFRDFLIAENEARMAAPAGEAVASFAVMRALTQKAASKFAQSGLSNSAAESNAGVAPSNADLARDIFENSKALRGKWDLPKARLPAFEDSPQLRETVGLKPLPWKRRQPLPKPTPPPTEPQLEPVKPDLPPPPGDLPALHFDPSKIVPKFKKQVDKLNLDSYEAERKLLQLQNSKLKNQLKQQQERIERQQEHKAMYEQFGIEPKWMIRKRERDLRHKAYIERNMAQLQELPPQEYERKLAELRATLPADPEPPPPPLPKEPAPDRFARSSRRNAVTDFDADGISAGAFDPTQPKQPRPNPYHSPNHWQRAPRNGDKRANVDDATWFAGLQRNAIKANPTPPPKTQLADDQDGDFI